MILITDWWGALASALITTTGSFRSPAARRSSALKAVVLPNAVGLRLIE